MSLKDANDLLQANRAGDIKAIVYAAVAWRPPGIVNAKDDPSDVLAPRDKVQSFRYPSMMPKLQAMTGGIRVGEVTYMVAGTGVGKSTDIREIIHDLVHGQGAKVGLMDFENIKRDTKLLLMSVYASERLQLIPLPDPDLDDFEEQARSYDAKMRPLHEEVFGCGLYELFDAASAEWSMDAVMGYVRYMARALGCQIIFIDPLSFIAALAVREGKVDERLSMDLVAAEMAQAAKELGIAIIISHHLRRKAEGIPHEEGATTSLNELRSSGGLANFATCVIGWERNNQAPGDGFRVTMSRVLKPHRLVGLSGPADTLYYMDNGRTVQSQIPMPPPGKPKGAGEEGPPTRFTSTEY